MAAHAVRQHRGPFGVEYDAVLVVLADAADVGEADSFEDQW